MVTEGNRRTAASAAVGAPVLGSINLGSGPPAQRGGTGFVSLDVSTLSDRSRPKQPVESLSSVINRSRKPSRPQTQGSRNALPTQGDD